MKIEPCAYCGHVPTVNNKQKMISCKMCGFPWVAIDRWNETMKAVAHYKTCLQVDDVKEFDKAKKEIKW